METSPNAPQARMTLVVGVDASGKSTFLDQFAEKYGATIVEPTANNEVKEFKTRSIDVPVTSEFINKRELMFLRHNTSFERNISQLESLEVATTGNKLVTRISHCVMRSLVDVSFDGNQLIDVAREWAANDKVKPNDIVQLRAPIEVILERIKHRQSMGDVSEKFWGFNSPHFFTHYQEAWSQIIADSEHLLGVPAISLDTSKVTPSKTIETYSRFRGTR